MTLPRRRIWLTAALAAMLIGATAAWLLWPDANPPLTLATFEQLRMGMPRAEIEAILVAPGRTRDDCATWMNNRSPTPAAGNDLMNADRDLPNIEYWYQDSGILILRFNPEGRLADKQFMTLRVSTARQRVGRLLERIGW